MLSEFFFVQVQSSLTNFVTEFIPVVEVSFKAKIMVRRLQ